MPNTATNPVKTPETADAAPAAPARRSPLLRIAVISVVVVVVLAECLVAYLCLPSAAGSAAAPAAAPEPAKPAAPAAPATKPAASKAPEQEAKIEEPSEGTNVEVDLGEFSVTAFQPASNTTLRIDFHLFGTVSSEDDKEFRRLLEENKHRFREQVLMTVRGAEMTDLTDASLGLIKRIILDKSRRILGKSLLREVIVSDFSFIEQ